MAMSLARMVEMQIHRGQPSLRDAAQIARAAREDRVTSVEAPAATAAAQAERPTDTRLEEARAEHTGRRLDLSWVKVASTMEAALQASNGSRAVPHGSLLA